MRNSFMTMIKNEMCGDLIYSNSLGALCSLKKPHFYCKIKNTINHIYNFSFHKEAIPLQPPPGSTDLLCPSQSFSMSIFQITTLPLPQTFWTLLQVYNPSVHPKTPELSICTFTFYSMTLEQSWGSITTIQLKKFYHPEKTPCTHLQLVHIPSLLPAPGNHYSPFFLYRFVYYGHFKETEPSNM